MRITRVSIAGVRLPLERPIRSAITTIRHADCLLVTLETGAGAVGEGLVMVLDGRGLAAIRAVIEELAPLVTGLDPTDAGEFHDRAMRMLTFLGHAGIAIQGLAGIDTALWDLRGKLAGLNVARLLGRCRASVPTYASGGLWLSASIDELEREAAGFLAAGFRAMKMRLGMADPREDAARVRAVRQAIGPDIALMADANQQLTVPQAIRLGRMLDTFDLAWFEEPVPYHDHAGEAAIAASLDTPIASGETEYTERGMRAMLTAGAADILMPDLQRMGGATGFLRAGHLAAAFDRPLASHLFSEMSLPLLAALPAGRWLEHMPWLEPLYQEPIELDADGHAVVPDRPGWGFTFDPDAIRRFASG